MNKNQLLSNVEFSSIECILTLRYMGKIHIQAEMLTYKILFNIGKLFSEYEAREIIEAFTIKTLCDWELYVEKILCQCLKDDTSNLSKQMDLLLPKIITTEECLAYLHGLNYFDIKSASNLKSVASKILIDKKNPFKNITNEAKNYIDDYYGLRNYIAHKSLKSKKALLRIYKKYNQDSFIEVGEFLLNTSDNKEILNIQNFEGSFWSASYNILQFLSPNIYEWILQSEQNYNDECHKRFLYVVKLSSEVHREIQI